VFSLIFSVVGALIGSFIIWTPGVQEGLGSGNVSIYCILASFGIGIIYFVLEVFRKQLQIWGILFQLISAKIFVADSPSFRFPDFQRDTLVISMKIFLAVFLYCLRFLAASPTGAKVCDRPLNVLLLGYMGTGKSSIVNVLHGLLDLEDDDDDKAVARTSYGGDSCTRDVSAYSCSHNGISLRVIDTPGFEESDERNDEISSQILSEVPNLFRDGFDAFFLVVKMDRTSYPKLSKIMNSLNSLINEEGYKHGFVVFTNADNVFEDGEKENEVIQEFKDVMLNKNAASVGFLGSVKYLFYRHNKLTYVVNNQRKRLNGPEVREKFLQNAYTAIYQKCIENNGRALSNLAMKKAKESYEAEQVIIEEYRKKRLELKRLYENLVATTGTLSADLKEISDKAKKLAPQTFEIVNQHQKTQQQILQDEKDFEEKNKEFTKTVRSFHFTRDQIERAAKNVTTLMQDCQLTFETYSNVTKNFTETFHTMQPVKISDSPLIPVSSTASKNISSKDCWKSLVDILKANRDSALITFQLGLNEAFKYYKEKFQVVADEIKNSTIVMPKLNDANPTLSNYKSHIENLKTFNETVSLKVEKIRNSTIEMEKVPSMSDYPNIKLLVEIGEKIDKIEELKCTKLGSENLIVTLVGRLTPAVKSLPSYYTQMCDINEQSNARLPKLELPPLRHLNLIYTISFTIGAENRYYLVNGFSEFINEIWGQSGAKSGYIYTSHSISIRCTFCDSNTGETKFLMIQVKILRFL
ncbi:hypothetical protein ROZALSC1DRAFT_24423, partial [Rozella allomycis CSF55]